MVTMVIIDEFIQNESKNYYANNKANEKYSNQQ